jgi:hypothetical protein
MMSALEPTQQFSRRPAPRSDSPIFFANLFRREAGLAYYLIRYALS